MYADNSGAEFLAHVKFGKRGAGKVGKSKMRENLVRDKNMG